ncbi:MAG: HAMP domain-containing histidine kinase [Clostridia bacterium]|nr:HAMP domain-containing histidine kinase [Clostridia bacterium]
MDTKSKSIKHSRWLKLAALILAILMFFMAGNFASLFIKGFANFNIYANPGDFTNTYVFRDQMNSYIWSVYYEGQTNIYETFDEFVKSEDAKAYEEKYVEQAKDVEEAYKLLDASGIEVYVDAQNRYRYALTHKGIRYFFNCGGTRISKDAFDTYDYADYEDETEPSEQTTALDGSMSAADVEITDNGNGLLFHDPHAGGDAPEYIKEISDALEVVHNVDGHRDYGESTKERLLEVIENNRAIGLENAYYDSFYNYYSNATSNVESINYAIFYKDSGEVYTNCGITAEDSDEAIYKKLNVTRWAEECKNGEYKLLAGYKSNTANSFYATAHEWLFGLWEKNIFGNANSEIVTETEKVYFSYNEDYKGSDPFTNIKNSFESYGKGHSLTAYFVLTFVCLAVACAACIYLLSAAGKTADGTKINFFDKVPVEINWALGLAVMVGVATLAGVMVVYEMFPFDALHSGRRSSEIVYAAYDSAAGFTNVIKGVCVSAFFMIWTGLNASLLRNIRNKTFFKYSIVFFLLRPLKWIFKKLWKLSKRVFDKIGYIFTCDYSRGQGKKFKLLACTGTALFMLATIIYYCIAGGCISYGNEFLGFILLLLGIIGDGAVITFILLLITSQHRLMSAVSDMRNGRVTQGIDKKYMPPFMKRFADDILFMQDGLQKAVDSAVKDQRMKAELITNVSHDLKTPLTSIVNYVDLLKKCEIEDETAQRYVSILDEKSHKMKKLIEDLVEASKASSGAVEIHPVKLNLCEFAAQAVGEHEDELRNHNIEAVLKMPEEPVFVIADAQKTSRIAENLFSNIRKYALEGTRVYVDVVQGKDFSMITFKNVSKHQLDVSAEELTQRFVRGDASRSGEGSGLGLSIAKDLCELQNGKLLLQTDGDLFKAIIALPTVK